jgi:prepilin-type N-terminal cleavage/methylation domain-containing protein
MFTKLKNSLKKSDSEKGFTIIEVMIVLAIAGLILLIVFLAVPALQRNSRNTQRKNDVANVAGAVNEYVSNNSGKLPTTAAIFQSDVMNNVKLGYYPASTDITYATTLPGSLPAANADKAYVYGASKCSGNSIVTGTTRQAAVLFWVESQSGTTPQCQDV